MHSPSREVEYINSSKNCYALKQSSPSSQKMFYFLFPTFIKLFHLLLFHFPPVLWHPYYFVKKEDTFIFVFCPRSSFCLGSSSPICEYVPPATSFKSLINISWNTVWTIALKLHLFPPTVPIPFTLMHFMTN